MEENLKQFKSKEYIPLQLINTIEDHNRAKSLGVDLARKALREDGGLERALKII